jgi:hypothetical protein
MDIIYIGVVIAFFALTWGLMTACDILGEQQSGDRL